MTAMPYLRMVQIVLDASSQRFLRNHPVTMPSAGVADDEYAHHVTVHYLDRIHRPWGLHHAWPPGLVVEIQAIGYVSTDLIQALVVEAHGHTHQVVPPEAPTRRLHITLGVRGDLGGKPVDSNALLTGSPALTPVTWRLSGQVGWVEMADEPSKTQRTRTDQAVVDEYRYLLVPLPATARTATHDYPR